MDVLKVFNLMVCADKKTEKSSLSSGWIFNIIFAPLSILFSPTKFAILGWFTVFIFFILIYSSQASVLRIFNRDAKGNLSWINTLFSSICLYIFQTTIILLFLRYSICEQSLGWENDDYHLKLEQYANEEVTTDGY